MTVWGLDRHNLYTRTVASFLKHLEGRLVPVEEAQAWLRNPVGEAPSAVLDMNFCGATARLFGEKGIPYAGIVWDAWIQSPLTPPRFEHYKPTGKDFAFVFDRSLIPGLKAKGVAHVEFLPACCDPELFKPMGLPKKGIAFYATPGEEKDLLSPLRKDSRGAGLLAFLEACLVEQEADLFRYRLPEILAEKERKTGGFLVSKGMTPAKETLIRELSLGISRKQRLAVAEVLGPLGIDLWGDGWGKGQASYESLPGIIHRAAVNMSVTKCHALGSVPPRVFEVLSCGGFLLAQRQEALFEFFEEGKDLACFETKDELREKAEYYLGHAEERERIALSGMGKARKMHGFRQRAGRLAEAMEM